MFKQIKSFIITQRAIRRRRKCITTAINSAACLGIDYRALARDIHSFIYDGALNRDSRDVSDKSIVTHIP